MRLRGGCLSDSRSIRTAGARWTLVVAGIGAFILVPFALVGPSLESWAATLVNDVRGHRILVATVIALLLAVDVVLPIPSSILSTVAGALLGFLPGTLVSLAGMTIGCVGGYWLGRTGGRGAARSVVGDRELGRLGAAAGRYGAATIVLTRAVPVLAEAATIVAGMSRMPARRFYVVVVMANAGVSAAYAAVGAFAVQIGSFFLAFAGAIVIPSLAFAVWAGLRRRQEAVH